jgi:hypothetical protein
MLSREVSINGEAWDIVPVRPSALTVYRKGREPEYRAGDCVVPRSPRSRLSRKERRIRIDKTLSDEELLETLIHEYLHAANPDKNEEWIEDPAEDLKNILWAFGFRRTNDAA